jgi:hypothetical protein
MMRIVVAAALALTIAVVWSASAVACIVYGTPSVSAPNGQSGPSQQFIRCLPNNKGTQKAATGTDSPAVNLNCNQTS